MTLRGVSVICDGQRYQRPLKGQAAQAATTRRRPRLAEYQKTHEALRFRWNGDDDKPIDEEEEDCIAL